MFKNFSSNQGNKIGPEEGDTFGADEGDKIGTQEGDKMGLRDGTKGKRLLFLLKAWQRVRKGTKGDLTFSSFFQIFRTTAPWLCRNCAGVIILRPAAGGWGELLAGFREAPGKFLVSF